MPYKQYEKVEKNEETSSEDRNQGRKNSNNFVRDKKKRVIKPPQRKGQAEQIAFALTIAE